MYKLKNNKTRKKLNKNKIVIRVFMVFLEFWKSCKSSTDWTFFITVTEMREYQLKKLKL